MGLTTETAIWFLPFILPACLFVAFDDLRAMKIRNLTVLYILGVFAVVGLVAFPFQTYLWQWVHVPIALAVGIFLNAARVMGAGDAKFIAAASPFFVFDGPIDVWLVMILWIAASFAGVATHRMAKRTPLRKATPNWESWGQGKRYPMGLTLGPMLAIYLLLPFWF